MSQVGPPPPPSDRGHQGHPELNSVGPYLLGALSPADREAFRAHLELCPTCQAELLDLSAVPAVLGAHRQTAESGLVASAAGDAEAPQALLEKSLRRLAQERRRQRATLRGLSAGLAGALVALVLLVAPAALRSGPTKAQTVSFVDTVEAPVLEAKLVIKPTSWGTQLEVRASNPPKPGEVIEVMAVNAAGQTLQVATWQAGTKAVDCIGSAWWPARFIHLVELKDTKGTVLATAIL